MCLSVCPCICNILSTKTHSMKNMIEHVWEVRTFWMVFITSMVGLRCWRLDLGLGLELRVNVFGHFIWSHIKKNQSLICLFVLIPSWCPVNTGVKVGFLAKLFNKWRTNFWIGFLWGEALSHEIVFGFLWHNIDIDGVMMLMLTVMIKHNE